MDIATAIASEARRANAVASDVPQPDGRGRP
jgi:hypothetical protein